MTKISAKTLYVINLSPIQIVFRIDELLAALKEFENTAEEVENLLKDKESEVHICCCIYCNTMHQIVFIQTTDHFLANFVLDFIIF